MRPLLLVGALVGCAGQPQPPRPAAPASVRAAAAPTALLPVPSYLTSSRITAVPAGALVSDADSGTLVEVGPEGDVLATLPIGRGAGLVTYDPARALAFVADRAGDRIVIVDVTARAALRAVPTPAEPFAVALTPDRATLLVTTLADRTLVAYDTRTDAERWRVPLAADARAIAVSPDGARALITGGAAIQQVALDGHHAVTSIPFDLTCDHCAAGAAFARGEAVVFLDQFRAVASFQRSVPQAIERIERDVYGGAQVPPVTQHLSFLSFGRTTDQTVAQIAANRPRSLLWDRTRDVLFIAGLASDALLRLNHLTHATTDDTEEGATGFLLRGAGRCGPDGLVETAEGTVLVWCSLSRTVFRIAPAASSPADFHESAPIAASALTPDQHAGLVLFTSVHTAINRDGALTCGTCHVDGLADGHSWKIHALALQTPVLAGRLGGTQPYKWDGSDPTLEASLASTIHRLGGTGLPTTSTASLVAYLATLARPRTPTLDAAAVARGKTVFIGPGGCAACHAGARLTDNASHHLDGGLLRADTPSLVGLAASAPYYHDGSAPTLDALVRGDGRVHGMGNLGRLTAAQRADLAAYLASL